MADIVTRFEADEAVSRTNFNSRIDEMNNGLAELKKTADAAKAITDTKGQAGGLATLDENGNLVQKTAEIDASEITGGTLPVARGGTGATTAAAALTALGAAAASHTHTASEITSGTLPVSRGGTGAAAFTSGAALIGAGTGAVTTRTIRNNTATSGAVTADTALITSNTLRYAINRTTSVAAADANYTTVMARGIYAGTTAMTAGTTALTNGVIYLQYE